jgi:hypothetical protein
MLLYSIPLAILVVIGATLALLIFTPVVVLVDSRSRDVKVRWSFLLSYVRPFPGAETHQELSVAGMPVPLPRPKRAASPSIKNRPEAGRVEARKGGHNAGKFIWNCLLDGDIRSRLAQRFRRLPVDLWDAVEVRRLHCHVSLPDPALNGMLWGALSAAGPASPAWLRCNFMGRNEVQTEVRLYPHLVLKAILSFFLQLPYWALLRQWRAS